jgi:hypothetical protein
MIGATAHIQVRETRPHKIRYQNRIKMSRPKFPDEGCERIKKSKSQRRWLVSSSLDTDTVLGKFNTRVFKALKESGDVVVAYLAEASMKQAERDFNARFIPLEVFCSESRLELLLTGKRNLRSIDKLMSALNDTAVVTSYLRITDRMMCVPQSAAKRLRLLKLTIEFWLNIIEECDCDAIWFPSTPHFGFDTILAQLAPKFGIEVFIVNRTEYEKIYLVSSGIGSNVYLERPAASDAPLNSAWIGYSRKLISDSIEYNKRLDHSKLYKLSVIFRTALKLLRQMCIVICDDRWYRNISATYMVSASSATLLPALAFRAFQSRKLWNSYREASTANLPRPYIFFAWSFQPERSTDPEAGQFADLEFCVDYVRAALPKEWTLVVKEHPRQFDGPSIDLRKVHSRAMNTYKQLAQRKGVVIADLSVESKELARGAIGCITPTGSIGFEALQLGKAVACFGSTWYSGLHGCSNIDTQEKLQSFISELKVQTEKTTNKEFTDRVRSYLSGHHFLMPSKMSKKPDFSLKEFEKMVDCLVVALRATNFSTLREVR